MTLSPTQLAPEQHPLYPIDQYILSYGWTHDGDGFLPPPAWRAKIATANGGDGSEHWNRENAIRFCVRFGDALIIPLEGL